MSNNNAFLNLEGLCCCAFGPLFVFVLVDILMYDLEKIRRGIAVLWKYIL